MAVDKYLERGSYEQCFACRMPLSREDLQSEKYGKGISCPQCIDSLSDKKYKRVSERQRQVELADSRAQKHIGVSQQSGSNIS